MTKSRILLILSVLFLLAGNPSGVSAQEPTPATSLSAPLPPDAAPPETTPSLNAPQPNLAIPGLKAVLVVGPIDGGTTPGPVTTREINAAELAAAELEANGVSVTRFYSPNTSWAQIQAAAAGAHFFMYRGHGISWSPMPTPAVGGMGLNERIFSNDEIRAALHLAPNAVVMIYACFAGGSSDTDTSPISLAEARRRVDEYSAPYFDLGASAVFTSWYPEAFQMYIRYLFQGMTFGQAFKTFYDFDPAMANLGVHPSRPGLDFWLEYENWQPYPIPPYQYDSSFVGKSGATLQSLFAPVMALSVSNIGTLAKPNSSAVSRTINVGASAAYAFTWTASDSASWVSISPSTGQNGGSFTVQMPPGAAPGVYDTDVTVSTTDPLIANKTAVVHVHLVVTNTIYRVYTPVALR